MSRQNIEPGWYSEAGFTKPTAECPHPEYWHSYDLQGTEAEVIDLVGGLVRGLQPDVVLETGTSRGFMAAMIGHALTANGHGHLHTYEPDEETFTEAVATVAEVAGAVTVHNEPSMVPWTHGAIDFAWFDSLVELRWPEFDFYFPHMSHRCVVGFHDTAEKFGDWPVPVRDDVRIQSFDLPTPRGVILGRVIKDAKE